MAGTLFVVATPIGNLEDITARALRVLREVSVIAAEDTRRTAQLLARYGITTNTTSLHQHNERTKSGVLVKRLLAGESVAVVSDAGTPGISDPGARFVQEAVDAGIRVEPIPGPSAITALLSVAGSEIEAFTFLGFPPTRSKDRKPWLDRLAASSPSAIFYEAPHRILATLEDVKRIVGDVDVVIGRELTKAHEELVRGPISSALSRLESTRGEFVVLVQIGQKPHYGALSAPITPLQLLTEFGDLTESGAMTRRQAIAALSRRHRMAASVVYDAIEAAKKARAAKATDEE